MHAVDHSINDGSIGEPDRVDEVEGAEQAIERPGDKVAVAGDAASNPLVGKLEQNCSEPAEDERAIGCVPPKYLKISIRDGHASSLCGDPYSRAGDTWGVAGGATTARVPVYGMARSKSRVSGRSTSQ